MTRRRPWFTDRERIEQFGALLVRLASAGLGYAMLAGAARVTTLTDFGDFALMMTVSAMCGAIATLGQETLLLRRLPLIRARALAGYRAAVSRGAGVAAAGVSGFAIVAMVYGMHSFLRPGPALIAYTGVLVLANGAAELLFAIGRGGGSVLGAVFRRELVWKLVLLAAIAAAFVAGRRLDAAALAGWYLAGTLGTVTLSLVPVVRLWRRAPAGGGSDVGGGGDGAGGDGRRDGGAAFFLLNCINQAGAQLDILVLGLAGRLPPVELGAYYAAQRTIQLLYILPYGASITSAPKVPLAWARRDAAEVVRLSRQISREVALVVVAIAVAAALLRGHVLGFFRPEFAAHAWVLPVLMVGPCASALGGLHNMVAPMCGDERGYARWRLGLILGFLPLKLAAAASQSLLLFACLGAAEQIAVAATGVLLARRRLGAWIV